MNLAIWSRYIRSAVVVILVVLGAPAPRAQAQDIGSTTDIQVGTLPLAADIVFWSTRNLSNVFGPANLYVMSRTGANVVQMTFAKHVWEHATVSPDRRYMAANRYENNADPNQSSLYIIDLKNKTEAKLVPALYSAGNGGIDRKSVV